MKKIAALVLLLSLLAGCGGAAGQPGAAVAKEPAAQVDERITAAGTRFGIDLLKQVYAAEKNSFLSPASASLILSLTAAGARGETLAEMLQALRYPDLPLEEIHRGNGALQSILTNPDPQVEIALANAIWHRQDLQVAAALAETARQHYGAQIEPAPFGRPEAVERINQWTAQATRGKISQLLQSTEPTNVMILVNALYFKGAWTHPFDPQRTADRPFTRFDGTRKQIPFMTQERNFAYLEGEGFQAVRLPYGQERVALYLFLPDDLSRFVAGLTAERWSEWMGSFTEQKGTLLMPRVRLEATHLLNEPLQRMGMVRAFGSADFSGLFEGGQANPFIALVLQKSFLEINEQGSEAAAATAVVLDESAGFNLTADRPFLIAIRDDQTGALLFIGTVVEP
ncbi:MAG: serpin family protein [Bacillota bacterium]